MIDPPSSSPKRDAPISATRAPRQETRRLRALKRYDILDTPAETGFDRVTDLAARLFDVPVVILGFVDGERVWFKSTHGLADEEVHREISLCGQVVDAGGGCESGDTWRDPLWTRHPFVTGAFGMRAFLAAPLSVPEGPILGSLCIVDRRPRAWTAADRASLGDLAGIVMAELEMRRLARSRWKAADDMAAARYRELFDATPQPMWVYDLETLRFLAVNEAAIQRYGYSREEFLSGMTMLDIRPSEDVPRLLEHLRQPADSRGHPLWRHRRKDGTLIDVEVTANSLTTYDGRPARLVMPYDVSERLRAEKSLQVRERHLAGLVATQRELLRAASVQEVVPGLLAALGRAADADRACVYQVGYEAEPDGRLFADLTDEWHAPGVRSVRDDPATGGRIYPAQYSVFNQWFNQLRRGEVIFLEDRPLLPEPERRFLASRGVGSILFTPLLVGGALTGVLSFHFRQQPHALLRGEHNPLLGAATALAVALERERSAGDLAAQTRRLAVTLAALAEGVITTDADGRVVVLNHAAETLTGRPAAESLGRPLREIFRTFETPQGGAVRAGDVIPGAAPERLPRAGRRQRVWLEAVDGQRRLIDKVLISVLDAYGSPTGFVRVFRDVTNEDRLAAEMLKASRLDSLGLLAGGIAHDFNNILTSIMGNISLARHDSAGRPADKRLDQAERACARARDLTGQLLTFARGGAPLKKLARLPEVIRESIGFALHGSAVRVQFDVSADLWPVEADTGQLSQVLNNLAINGIQAMGHDGGTLGVRAENLVLDGDDPLGLPGGHYVKIAVEDNGCGIPAGELERIFDPFFTTKPGGTGLGLATSYSIAKRHGGLLNVDSTPGVGSVFRLFLPAAEET